MSIILDKILRLKYYLFEEEFCEATVEISTCKEGSDVVQFESGPCALEKPDFPSFLKFG